MDDNTELYNPNLFPAQPTVGGGSGYPVEMSNLGNPGSAPQLPYTIGSGVERGTKIWANPDGSQTLIGQIPNTNTYGIALLDPNGRTIETIIGGVTTINDLSTGNPIPRIISGPLPDGTYGMRVALPGNNAATSNNLSFNSSQLTGSLDIPPTTISASSSVTQDFEISHNFGFAPPFEVYASLSGVSAANYMSGITPADPIIFVQVYNQVANYQIDQVVSGQSITFSFRMAADTKNVYIQAILNNLYAGGSLTSQDMTLNYYIRQQAIATA